MSARQAEFLHHEAMGIMVPDEVRAEIASLDEAAAHVQEVSGENNWDAVPAL